MKKLMGKFKNQIEKLNLKSSSTDLVPVEEDDITKAKLIPINDWKPVACSNRTTRIMKLNEDGVYIEA